MKPTARIINCARGGIVDEAALLAALNAGTLAGRRAGRLHARSRPATMPTLRALIEHPHVVATPHLGASTEEAQVSVAVDVAEQIGEVLRGGAARAAVNAPMILPETMRQLQPWMALVEKLGRLYTQLHPGPLHRAELSVSGEIAQYDTRPLTAALIKGLLESVSEAHVNLVNAPVLAREWGLEIAESRSTTAEQYANLVTLRVSRRMAPRRPPSVALRDDHLGRGARRARGSLRHRLRAARPHPHSPQPRPPRHGRARRHDSRRGGRQHRAYGCRPGRRLAASGHARPAARR